MADVDDLDPLLLAAVVDREQVAAGEGEEVARRPRDASARATSRPPWTRPAAASLGGCSVCSAAVAIAARAYC